MKFTIEREALLSALNTIHGAVEHGQIPILANVLIRGSKNKLEFFTSNLDMSYAAEIAAEVERPAALTVPASILREIARKMPNAATIVGESQGEDLKALKVRCGRSTFILNTLPASDFPDYSVGELPHQFIVDADDLARMFGGCQFAISTEDTRYYLEGVYLHTAGTGKDMVLRAVATDGHRLARIQIKAPEGTNEMPGVIVPRATVGEVIKLCKDHDTIQVSLSQSKIVFCAGNVRLASKLIDGTYPDYERVVPKENNKVVTADRKSMSDAVVRVSLVSRERGHGVKLSMKAGSISFDVVNPDAGNAHEEMEVAYEAPPLEIGFNSQYLTDILDEIDTDEVEIKLGDPGFPTLFVPKGSDTSLYVLMPMRV